MFGAKPRGLQLRGLRIRGKEARGVAFPSVSLEHAPFRMYPVDDLVPGLLDALRPWLGPAHRARPPILDRAGVVTQDQGDLAQLVG